MNYNNKKYENKLGNKSKKPSQWLHKKEGYAELLKVVDGYDEYINNKERLLKEIIYKVKSYDYVNLGIRNNDGWEYNLHKVYINGFEFEYKTGMGIDCNDSLYKGFCQEKIVFDCLIHYIDDANSILCLDMDEFCDEFGYNDSLENVRKGEQVYRDIKKCSKELHKIINNETISDIRDIIEL